MVHISCNSVKKNKNKKINTLLNTHKHLPQNPPKSTSERWNSEISLIESQIELLEADKLCGALIRNKIKSFDTNEKMNKLFFNKLKNKENNKSILSLQNKQGFQEIEQKNINQVASHFYSELYSTEPTSLIAQNTLLNNRQHVPSSSINTHLITSESHINEQSISSIIPTLKNDTSPGLDGIGYEFCKSFQAKLARILKPLFITWISNQLIPCEMNTSKIILLFKKGDVVDIKNYRPISLINADVKIFSKLVTSWLKPLIEKKLCPYQSGFLSSRKIQQNHITVHSCLNQNSVYQKKGLMLFLDQKKAYDMVDRGWLNKCLDRLELDPTIRIGIKAILSNNQAKVCTNRNTSTAFNIGRGVRQGDSISPLLYNIAIDPILVKLDKELKGVQIDSNTAIKVSAFADDMMVCLGNQDDLNKFNEIMHMYK